MGAGHLAVLIGALLVDAVDVALVQVDEEDDIVTQAREPVRHGHLDDEREEVVHEGIERLVHKCLPRHMSCRLELVVDEELRRHQHEAERVDEIDGRAEEPRVPRLVRVVRERVGGVPEHARIERH